MQFLVGGIIEWVISVHNDCKGESTIDITEKNKTDLHKNLEDLSISTDSNLA
jgi:hypothetical protein